MVQGFVAAALANIHVCIYTCTCTCSHAHYKEIHTFIYMYMYVPHDPSLPVIIKLKNILILLLALLNK